MQQNKLSYSRTSRILALIFDFPPLGIAKFVLQTKQFILVDDFPNIICSFLHLLHRTLINLLDGFFIVSSRPILLLKH